MNLRGLIWDKHVAAYPSPKYLNYNWGFGSSLGLIVALQVLTGVLLAFYYKPSEATAFSDIVFIVNDVNGGYLLKYLHLNGATAIFLLMYLHLFRGLYYKSYVMVPSVWVSGMVLFVLMIVTAFLGYVLPWGQMSFWAATVITNLVTSIPVIGQKLIVYIHGAFSVQGATLNRFFVLHFLMALLVLLLIVLHIVLLHSHGSNNPTTRLTLIEKTHFYYYFVYKDLFFFLIVCLFLTIYVFLYPNAFNHPDNFIEADPLVTPAHIVPEWYFLPFYAILRAIPNKLMGVLAMLASLLVLFILPFITKVDFGSFNRFDKLLDVFFFGLLFCYMMLGYLGSMPAEAPYVAMSQFFTALYFALFLIPVFGSKAANIYK